MKRIHFSYDTCDYEISIGTIAIVLEENKTDPHFIEVFVKKQIHGWHVDYAEKLI